MTDFTDAFGATVTDAGAGLWTRGGITVGPMGADQAAQVFSGMAPDGWEPPPVAPVVPQEVDKWKLQAVLLNTPSKVGGAGSALDDANALAQQAGGVVALAWAHAATIERSSSTIAALAPRIGFTEAEIDAAFIATATLHY